MNVKRKSDDYLAHHGIKGQRWGVRRYQNADGSLTDAGRQRYGYAESVENRVKNASSKKEQSYIIRSEMRKNSNKVANTAAKGLAATVGTTLAGLGGGTVATLLGAETVGGIIGGAGVIAWPVGLAATAIVAGGSAYVNRNKNVKLADIADKYDIEDVKVRSSHQSS